LITNQLLYHLSYGGENPIFIFGKKATSYTPTKAVYNPGSKNQDKCLSFNRLPKYAVPDIDRLPYRVIKMTG
jgi:hypothetical protein